MVQILRDKYDKISLIEITTFFYNYRNRYLTGAAEGGSRRRRRCSTQSANKASNKCVYLRRRGKQIRQVQKRLEHGKINSTASRKCQEIEHERNKCCGV